MTIYVDLDKGDTKEGAKQMVEEAGWEVLTDNFCICPGCNEHNCSREEWEKHKRKVRRIK